MLKHAHAHGAVEDAVLERQAFEVTADEPGAAAHLLAELEEVQRGIDPNSEHVRRIALEEPPVAAPAIKKAAPAKLADRFHSCALLGFVPLRGTYVIR